MLLYIFSAGLSAGAVAGVVIAIIIIIALAVIAIVFILKFKRGENNWNGYCEHGPRKCLG